MGDDREEARRGSSAMGNARANRWPLESSHSS